MSENNPKKVSKGVLIGVVAAGAVLLATVIVLIVILVMQAQQAGGSLIGPWHNEEQTRQYTFYEDNKIIISTPYGNFVGQYAVDDKTGKGVISMEGASIDFRYEDDEVILETEGVQSKLLSGEINIAISESTTTEAETSASTDAVTETSDTSASSSETAAVTSETTESTPSPTPEATVTPTPTTETLFTGMSFVPLFPTFVLYGTPVVGEWVIEDTGFMTLTFDSDMTCLMEYDIMGIHSEQDLTYEYNFFTGQGTLIDGSETMDFVVNEDILTLTIDGDNGIFNRV
jgi:hypothetical protein